MKIGSAILCSICVMVSVLGGESTTLTPPQERITETISPSTSKPFLDGKFALEANEVVVFTGPENTVTEQRTGWLELALTTRFKDKSPRFRHLGWEGDTVYHQYRMMNWGSWKDNLDAVHATTVFAWFGQMEALDTTNTPADFAAAYAKLLDEFALRTPRIVIVAPSPFEKPANLYVPDNTPKNAIVQQHREIARKLAADRGLIFVDLYAPLAARKSSDELLTRDGIHFTPVGMYEVSTQIARGLGAIVPTAGGEEALRAAIIEKNRLWFDTWRCTNWAFAYGDRTTQPFAKASAVEGTPAFPSFVEDLKRHRPLMAHADETVLALANGTPAPAPLAPEPARFDPPAPSPEEEMSRFTLRDGYSINLVADEKLGVVRPVQMRWDSRGRLWVLCIPSYPQLLVGGKGNDYLLILEDTTGSGKFDKSTRFAEGLTMPMGFEFGDGGVYLCESTQLVHLRDTTGEGKANEKRVILSGFGTGDSHQNINSIRWQPDGNLWFTQGYHIWSYIETPHGITKLNRSGVYRFNPRTLKLDSFLNDSSAGLNCWGVAFDDYGQVFHGSGADTQFWHTTPATIPTLHPLILPGVANTVGKGLEPEFLQSSHLPDDMRGVLLKSTFFTSQIQLFTLQNSGAGYTSTLLGDLVKSSGKEFRPIETRVGPDGAIYVCDWLNQVIGHYQASYRDPRRDLSHGRIWRVTANGRPLLKRPEFEKMDTNQLFAAALQSPERWVRSEAQKLLYNLPKAEVLPKADALLKKIHALTPESARELYQLSGVFAAFEEPRPQIVRMLMASEDFNWRCWATRLVGYWNKQFPDALAIISRSAVDENPRVRMEAVIAASAVENPEAIKVATLVLDKPMDKTIRYALTQCIYQLQPLWEPALSAGTLDFGSRVEALVTTLTTISGSQSAAYMRRLIESDKVNAAAKDKLLESLVIAGSPDDLRYALDRSTATGLLNQLAITAHDASKRPSGDLGPTLEKLLHDQDINVRVAAFRLAAAWHDKAQLNYSRTVATDEKAQAVERAAAMDALTILAGKDASSSLLALTSNTQPEIRNAALAALVRVNLQDSATKAAELIATIVNADDAAPFIRPFLSQQNGPAALGAALAKNKPGAPAANAALEWLAKIGRDEAQIVTVLHTAAGVEARTFEYSAELVAKYVGLAKASGDAQRGSVVFHKSVCMNCHKIGTEGANIAPDLSAVGRAVTTDLIVEKILFPKRMVKENYILSTVTTKNGAHFQGFKVSETNDQLILRDATANKTETFAKSDLAKRRDGGTLMPEGLAATLTDTQIADLVRFLSEQGSGH